VEELAQSQESKPHMHLSIKKLLRTSKSLRQLYCFMFHIMLDAAGVVLRVHDKSMKCDVLFSQGSVSTIFW